MPKKICGLAAAVLWGKGRAGFSWSPEGTVGRGESPLLVLFLRGLSWKKRGGGRCGAVSVSGIHGHFLGKYLAFVSVTFVPQKTKEVLIKITKKTHVCWLRLGFLY